MKDLTFTCEICGEERELTREIMEDFSEDLQYCNDCEDWWKNARELCQPLKDQIRDDYHERLKEHGKIHLEVARKLAASYKDISAWVSTLTGE